MTLYSRSCKVISVCLAALLALSGCTAQVVLAPPYPEKIRVGDGVKLVLKDGTIHAGRVVYVDRGSIVLRTPKQKQSEHPVEVAQFGATVPWSEVVRVKVAGTLDNHGKLISNEEIRVNIRTAYRRNFAVNFGLLGLVASFLTGVYVQDRIAPFSPALPTANLAKGRAAFWATFVTGSLASALLGYEVGHYRDRQFAIARIERQREKDRKAAEARADSLQQPTQIAPSLLPP